MPLFGSRSDARLISSITRELFHKIISIEVELIKIALPETEKNLYGESNNKTYYQPIRLFANVSKDEATFVDTEMGMDLSQTVKFAFLKDDLICLNTMIAEGDIIKFDERYYEVDSAFTTQYFMGRNDKTHLITTENRDRAFGKDISVVAQTHLVRLSQINIIEFRSGVTNTPNTTKLRPKGI